jgi:2'-hydroxyisoflavone reductase
VKLLILGGTQFVGRHMTEAALARNHEVTLFNRGQRNPELFPDVEKLQGDRAGDLSALKGRQWDAVLDVSGYVPRHVRNSMMALADAVEHYTFVSTISVYAEPFIAGGDETAPLATLSAENEGTEEVTGETYGALKVLCERAAAEAMPGRVLTLRLGLMVGPYDHTDRFTYWIMRTADKANPDMVIPLNPRNIPMQIMDARDLAAFTLDKIETRQSGIYNTTGPEYPLTLGKVLETARTVTGEFPNYKEIAEAALLEKGVQPWVDLPLWLPADSANLHRVDNRNAIDAGLTFMPLEQTMRDIYEWRQTWTEPFRAGWSREREQEFLA